MSEADPALEAVLHQRGHRLTRPRLLVWSVLSGTGQHLTVEVLTQQVNEIDSTINRASIYRTLRLFQELNMVRESSLGEGESWWELSHPDEHIHLVCDRCGSVDHHVGSLVETMARHLDDHHGFEVGSIDVVVKGRCPACRSGR